MYPRETACSRGYDRQWRKRREAYLRDHPLCVGYPLGKHEREGRVVAAEHVDHIVPHKGDEAKFKDDGNLQGLCAECHSSKTASEDGGFGRG